MYLKSWGVYGAGITFREVNTTLCTKDHFNDVEGSNPESKFFKTFQNSEADLNKYGTAMKCITDDMTSIFGNYDTASAENFVVVFETCDSNIRTCKTDQEIKDWI